MVVQNISSDGKQTDLTFTRQIKSFKTETYIRQKIKFKKLIVDKNVAEFQLLELE